MPCSQRYECSVMLKTDIYICRVNELEQSKIALLSFMLNLNNVLQVLRSSAHWLAKVPLVYIGFFERTDCFLSLKTPRAIIVPHRIIWSWYTGRWWVGCYIWYSEEGPMAGCGSAQSPPRCTNSQLIYNYFWRLNNLQLLSELLNRSQVCNADGDGNDTKRPVNPLDSKGNYSSTSNNTKLLHWSLMGVLLHLVQRGPAQSPPCCTKCNSPWSINGQCTNHCIAIWWSVALQF